MTDYEFAMRNALRFCFPQSEFHACWFHFTQACKRHAAKIPGFVAGIRGNATARSIYCRTLCLPLLPAEKIVDAFQNLQAEAREYDERFSARYMRYFQTQWIDSVS